MRLAAQRLLLDLLPAADSPGPAYALDLTGASLEYFDLRTRRTGDVVARRATFYGITRLHGAVFGGKVLLTGALFRGRLELAGSRFSAGLSLHEAQFDQPVDLTRSRFAGFADLRWKEPATVAVDGATADDGTTLKTNGGTAIRRGGAAR